MAVNIQINDYSKEVLEELAGKFPAILWEEKTTGTCFPVHP